MGLKKQLAKLAPKGLSDRAIDKGEHKGDDWATVSVVMMEMCEMEMASPERMNFKFNGKDVGWAKKDGTSWCDDKAYSKIKEAFNNLPEGQKEAALQKIDYIREKASTGAIATHPRDVREGKPVINIAEMEDTLGITDRHDEQGYDGYEDDGQFDG